MQGHAGPPPESIPSAHRQSWVIGFVAALGVLVVAVLLASGLPENVRHVISTVAMLVSALALATACRARLI